MSAEENTPVQPYRVLARKYRPRTFSELIGQESMVRTLTNAIHADRLPHAFILTGVRGVGKTSTARIIARALNCVGVDGNSGPTSKSCGVCPHCKAITEDRHVDVVEMDAASRTGVNDIRELIEGVRYRPVDARFKIYIIDEVHMLSSSAFNALLKTLEEPPEHVKFIFATTETRKIPVTVLSRCQRFDLRRVDVETLIDHFNSVAKQEKVKISPVAIELIANAADGSVRDGLSLLDQAIAHAGITEDGEVLEDEVREMLGLADVGLIYDIFEAVMKGAVDKALTIFNNMYDSGADPIVVLQDLLKLTHWLTRIKLSPAAAKGAGVAQIDRDRGLKLSELLTVPILGRTWQLLLKGIDEVQSLSNSSQAVEMVLIRLTYMADLPTPADLIRKLEDNDTNGHSDSARILEVNRNVLDTPSQSLGVSDKSGVLKVKNIAQPDLISQQVEDENDLDAPDKLELAVPTKEKPVPIADQTFEDIVAMFEERREAFLHSILFNQVHLVRFEVGHIAIRTEQQAPPDLATRVSSLLSEWTSNQWLVSLSDKQGDPTLQEQIQISKAAKLDKATKHPQVQAVMETFPGATVEAVVEQGTEDHLESGTKEPED